MSLPHRGFQPRPTVRSIGCKPAIPIETSKTLVVEEEDASEQAYLTLLVMQVFKDFSWCVPAAFLNAVVSCCFGVGDILYSDAAAYEWVWKEAVQRLRWSLQVKEATAATVADGETIFDANWARGLVLVERTDYLGGRCLSRLIQTTQGKIYHTLVTGDPAVLELEGSLTVQRIEEGLMDIGAMVAPEDPRITRIEIRAVHPATAPEPMAAAEAEGLVQGLLF